MSASSKQSTSRSAGVQTKESSKSSTMSMSDPMPSQCLSDDHDIRQSSAHRRYIAGYHQDSLGTAHTRHLNNE